MPTFGSKILLKSYRKLNFGRGRLVFSRIEQDVNLTNR